MKKTILLITIVLVSFFVHGQKKDSIDISGIKTTARATPKPDTVYFLLGTLVDFQVLARNIVRPTSVSEDDKNALIKWIQTIKPIQEADKPKKN